MIDVHYSSSTPDLYRIMDNFDPSIFINRCGCDNTSQVHNPAKSYLGYGIVTGEVTSAEWRQTYYHETESVCNISA